MLSSVVLADAPDPGQHITICSYAAAIHSFCCITAFLGGIGLDSHGGAKELISLTSSVELPCNFIRVEADVQQFGWTFLLSMKHACEN